MFNKAVKTESKLRMAIAGPSGSGKTYTALAIATALVPGGKVAVIDTEHGSAAKYADQFAFDVAQAAPPYHPDGLLKLVTFAANSGYDVVIVDSISHYWSGTGGILDMKEDAEKRMRNPNGYTAWKEITPIHQRMVDTLVAVPTNVIVTMRSKQDYILAPNKDGKMEPKKVGMAPVQRDGFEYEFDVMMDMDIENIGRIQKTRCPALAGQAYVKPGANVAGILREWLTGAAPEKAPAPVVFTPAPTQQATPPANALLYADGSFVGSKDTEIANYRAYVAAHNGDAPQNVHNLRNWYKQQQANAANGNAQPAPTVAAQDDLFAPEQEPAKFIDPA